MLKFNPRYFLVALLLFITEVLIAVFVDDNFIRPYVGDVLVVILMYCAIKAVFDTPVLSTATGVFAFACLIECLQYIGITKLLGWEQNKTARAVIGTSFEWWDIVAYGIGILIVLAFEYRIINFKKPRITETK